MPIKRIYEDMVARRLSPEGFDKFFAQYQETEQKQLRQVTEDKSSGHRRQKVEPPYMSGMYQPFYKDLYLSMISFILMPCKLFRKSSRTLS